MNLARLGSEEDVIRGMTAAHWFPADPIPLRGRLRIAVNSVLRRPDTDAPDSTLELFGRKQDMAFAQPVGDSPRRGHQVRFRHWDRFENGHEVRFGAATFDERVGLSHTTGQITHLIRPDVDAERHRLLSQLQKGGLASEVNGLPGLHTGSSGENGGGDPWSTEGRLGIAAVAAFTIVPSVTTSSTPP